MRGRITRREPPFRWAASRNERAPVRGKLTLSLSLMGNTRRSPLERSLTNPFYRRPTRRLPEPSDRQREAIMNSRGGHRQQLNPATPARCRDRSGNCRSGGEERYCQIRFGLLTVALSESDGPNALGLPEGLLRSLLHTDPVEAPLMPPACPANTYVLSYVARNVTIHRASRWHSVVSTVRCSDGT